MRARRWWTAWAVGGACVAVTLGPVGAQEGDTPASAAPIGSFQLSSAASGAELIVGDSISGTVPDAAANLETGGIGYGRASVAWPGALGANAGDLVILASAGQIPPEMEPTFRMLNYPVRAESRAPGGPEEASFSDAGVTMRSTATPTRSEATAEAERTDAPGALTFGSASVIAVSSHLEVVQASSASTVTDIELADGLITIGSVTSTALATSDGEAATGEAATVVSDVQVAGQPATIDQDGLRVGDDGERTALSDVANELAAQTLREAQVEVIVTEPTIDVQGPSATSTAGSLLIALGEGSNRMAVVFGGASASASAGPAFSVPALEAPPAPSASEPAAALGSDASGPGPAPLAATGGAPRGPADAPASSDPAASGPASELPMSPIAFFGRGNPLWLALLGAAAGLAAARALQTLGLGLADTTIPCTAEGTP
jgi:hypothetical protein